MRWRQFALLALAVVSAAACHGAAHDLVQPAAGSQLPSTSLGAATAPAGIAPASASAGANRLGCTSGILDAMAAEQDRDAPGARLLRCAALALDGSAGTGGTSLIVLRVGAAMVAAGRQHAAVELACDLGSPMMLVAVAAEISSAGNLEGATRLAAAIDDLRDRHASEPEHLLGGAGPQVLPRPPLDTSSLWGRIGVRQAEQGELAQAEASSRKARLYAGIDLAAYDWLRKAGKHAEATERLDRLKQEVRGLGFNDPAVVVEVASRLADAARKPEAAALLREERASTTAGKWGAGSRDELASGLARIGLVDEAIQLGRAGGSEENLASTARQLIAADRLADAEQVAMGLGDPYWQARVWAELAQHFHQSQDDRRADQDFARAEQAAGKIAQPRFRVEGLGSLAQAMAAAGRSAEADRVLGDALRESKAMPDADERRMSLGVTVESLARMGRCARALELCSEVGNDGYSIHDVAALCSNPAELDAIAARLGDIRYPDHRSEALAALATKYAERAEWRRALELAGSIEVGEQRALALSLMARFKAPANGLPAIPGCETAP